MLVMNKKIYIDCLACILIFSACKSTHSDSVSPKSETATKLDQNLHSSTDAKNLAKDKSGHPDEWTVYEQQLTAYELRLQGEGVSLRPSKPSINPDSTPVEPAQPPAPSEPKKVPDRKQNTPSTSSGSKARELGIPSGSAGRDIVEMCSQPFLDLASSICALKLKICELSALHPDEERYQQLCQRAETDCNVANEVKCTTECATSSCSL